MSAETVLLLAAGYLGMVTLVLCLLAMAKRGDQAAAPVRADRRADAPPRRRDAA